MPSWLGIKWKKMWTWAEKWQRSFNVTKCKKTYSMGNDFIRVSWVFNYNPEKNMKWQKIVSLSPVRCHRQNTKRLREWKAKKKKKCWLSSESLLEIQHKGFPILWPHLIQDIVLSCLWYSIPQHKWHDESRNGPQKNRTKWKGSDF